MEIIRYEVADPFKKNGENVVGVFAIGGSDYVGVIWGIVNPETGVAKLDTIDVNASLRGNGIGSGLISIFKEEVAKKGSKKIWGEINTEFGLKPSETRNFYKKNGFDVKEDGTFEAGI